MEIKDAVRQEVREVAWLASVVLSLSVLGVGAAVILALAFNGGLTFGVV